MRIYGLTGGTGSGKTEAARRFAVHGFAVIDADAIGHEVIAPGGVAERAVVEAFGSTIQTCGKIDRAKLGALVFADKTARYRLNAIVHPVIAAEIGRRCADYAEVGLPEILLDAALLGEDGAREAWLSGLILILCPVEERVRRLMANRDIPEAEARQRIAAQTPPEAKRALADWVIENDGTIEALHARVDAIAEAIRGTSR